VKALIVNADDFGLSDGVNAGILRAHRDGIVTSASLMVRQPAAHAAAAAAQGLPRLSLGLHVDLAGWELCDGEWSLVYAWADESDPVDVAREVAAQVRLFRELAGRPPTHLDSHQHAHRAEPLASVLARTATELDVPLRHHSPARYNGAFYGQGRAGEPLPAAITSDALSTLILGLPDGVTELCCHPAEHADESWAYGRERELELDSLCHPGARAALGAAGVRLTSFLEL
jgi:predicted glycoside hydrolase/deacetylase ChbG (UPF0249 family)